VIALSIECGSQYYANMCGRFITPQQSDIERHWHLVPTDAYRQSFNLAPSQSAWVIRLDGSLERCLEPLVWGFQPHWAQRAWINARAETVFSSKAFAPAAKRQRCLVPSIGWYEWVGDKPKQPYVFHLAGLKPFAYAGIFTARPVDGRDELNFAILTRAAAPAIASLHSRMPAIVPPEAYSAWLDSATPPGELAEILNAPTETVRTYTVSTYVNRPANNDAECMRKVDVDSAVH
jgi:putative SOS response-associated peptidase YedK